MHRACAPQAADGAAHSSTSAHSKSQLPRTPSQEGVPNHPPLQRQHHSGSHESPRLGRCDAWAGHADAFGAAGRHGRTPVVEENLPTGQMVHRPGLVVLCPLSSKPGAHAGCCSQALWSLPSLYAEEPLHNATQAAPFNVMGKWALFRRIPTLACRLDPLKTFGSA